MQTGINFHHSNEIEGANPVPKISFVYREDLRYIDNTRLVKTRFVGFK